MLLLDVELHDDPVGVTLRRVLRSAPRTRIVILTMHRDAILRREVLRLGADAYVTKSETSAQLVRTILGVGSQPESFPSSQGDQSSKKRIPNLLSERELQILRIIASAKSNRDISDQLFIAEGTVKRHLSNIYGKMGARSRMDAVHKAKKLGLL